MTKYNRLRLEALESCNRRGHTMSKFRRKSWPEHRVWNSVCGVCGMNVNINLNPMSNDIEIGGTAVALDCISKKYGLTDKEFDIYLHRVVVEVYGIRAVSLMYDMPEVYDILKEKFNNEVLDEWAKDHPELAYPENKEEEE